jgi:predicted CoA-substrate-specific enzyme activase
MSRLGLGIDIGAESLKLALLEQQPGRLRIVSTHARVHQKEPEHALAEVMTELALWDVARVSVTGRLHALVNAHHVPGKAAMRRGARLLRPELDRMTVLSIGAHGFCVLELSGAAQEHFQQNSRCSQGTGNFLTQLVERFGLTIEEASLLCEAVKDPCALSGRCPVILKTDMTHLANKGEDKRRILAGLYDAVCENVVSLLRPRVTPPDLLLTGGVTRSRRIRQNIATWGSTRGLSLLPAQPEDEFIEAIGSALCALEEPKAERATLGQTGFFGRRAHHGLDRVPALVDALRLVSRMPRLTVLSRSSHRRALLGLDIGSTGSKAVAIDVADGTAFYETYLNTEGAPVVAAQRLLTRFNEQLSATTELLGIGVTGSGREIVGSLLRTCYGDDRVFVLNEIAAHARGATSLDPDVDTIFEIGGQDAKYIRLDHGRVVDAAMNEACSAGTGSFIAEQGRKFGEEGLSVTELARQAMLADHGVSLGQHCSVFMAEVIDEAIAAGEERQAIIAGLYDSVVQNYLNRVKGARSVGKRIFCQGMPFSSDALAAAVARQTGRQVIVPPNPGTIGALGIALLTRDERAGLLSDQCALDISRFLGAVVCGKETIVCRSTKGCGGSGNKCRIDRLTTAVDGKEQRFMWGGNCSLYDRGAVRTKLPDGAPDPFRQREALLDQLIDVSCAPEAAPTIVFPDEFGFKGLTPLFLAFMSGLGLRCRILRGAGGNTLHRGIEGAGRPYCAPMQLVHGAYFELAESPADYLLLPIFQSLPRVAGEEHSTLCPMVIASSDIIGGLIEDSRAEVLRPVIDFDQDGYRGSALRRSLEALARSVKRSEHFELALGLAIRAQERFEADCRQLGEDALAYCREHGVVPIAVLGRPYTIHNDVLNSNVPSLLRSLGALAVPVDCLPVDERAPCYSRQFWSHTQRNLRAAEFIRRSQDIYAVFCSNYACGPDSFTLHFFAYSMENKPFGVIETDGHSGDAGTKTRLEAFLYCVDADRKSQSSSVAPRNDFEAIEERQWSWSQAKARGDIVLLPRMGPQAEIAAAALRADGFRAESLPCSTRDDVRTGRRYTSGKECVPMMLTLGTLLNRVAVEPDPKQTFAFFMPTAKGPCRFGVYNSLHKMTLERLGMAERVRVISPEDTDYFAGMSADFTARLWLGFLAHDLLQMMRLDVRPEERSPGLAEATYAKYFDALVELEERIQSASALRTVRELAGGMWGIRALLARAAREFAQSRRDSGRRIPTVAIVGEIYVRLDPFANDRLVERLEERGLRVQMAPFCEWLEYSNVSSERRLIAGAGTSLDDPLTAGITGLVQRVTGRSLHDICRREMGWGSRTRVEDILHAGERYVSPALTGEAVLTVGGPLHEFEQGKVDGVVIVGPHECMPCKISEAQYSKVGQDVDLPSLSIYVGGDGLDVEALDRFAFDLLERARNVSDAPLESQRRSLVVDRSAVADSYESELLSTGE